MNGLNGTHSMPEPPPASYFEGRPALNPAPLTAGKYLSADVEIPAGPAFSLRMDWGDGTTTDYAVPASDAVQNIAVGHQYPCEPPNSPPGQRILREQSVYATNLTNGKFGWSYNAYNDLAEY